MAVKRKVPARDWTFGIYDPDEGEGEYITIAGLTSFEYSPTKESAETTDFDSEGWDEHIPIGRGAELTFEGFYVEDDGGTRDDGQEYVESLAEKIGPEGLVVLHMESPYGGKELFLEGSIDLGSIGGDTNDATSWGFEFEVNGKPMIDDPENGGGTTE